MVFTKEWYFSIWFYFICSYPPYFLLNCPQLPSKLCFIAWKFIDENWNCEAFPSLWTNTFKWENTFSKLRANSVKWKIFSVLIFSYWNGWVTYQNGKWVYAPQELKAKSIIVYIVASLLSLLLEMVVWPPDPAWPFSVQTSSFLTVPQPPLPRTLWLTLVFS